MAKSIDFLIETEQPLADLAHELNALLDIDLQPATNSAAHYAFRAMTLTLDLYALASAPGDSDATHRYRISINGIFGSEEQRKKWTEDWSFSILQTLKARNYRLKRVEGSNINDPQPN